MSKKKIALEVKNVSKSFRLPTEQASGIKQAFINWTRGVKGYKEQQVLKNVSFTVEEGDFFGIVGRNGSGKSTLLKLISQIYVPDSGKITVNGKLVPFIELGVGFNPELTGRENVYLNGALLGFSHEEVSTMYEDIVQFAELEDFMDQKLKNYSSGMQVRLAFSIAIRADGAILVLDEVLAVGDEAFQRKCFNYFAELKKNKKTVILVTHSMDSVQSFCNKAIMLEGGKVVIAGNPAKVAQGYRELFMDAAQKISIPERGSGLQENDFVKINAHTSVEYKAGIVSTSVDIFPKIDIEDVVVTFEIIRDNGESVYRWVTDEKLNMIVNLRRNKKVSMKLNLGNIFPNGLFTIQVGVKKRDRTKEYLVSPQASFFEIVNRGSYAGDIRWKPPEEVSFKA